MDFGGHQWRRSKMSDKADKIQEAYFEKSDRYRSAFFNKMSIYCIGSVDRFAFVFCYDSGHLKGRKTYDYQIKLYFFRPKYIMGRGEVFCALTPFFV